MFSTSSILDILETPSLSIDNINGMPMSTLHRAFDKLFDNVKIYETIKSLYLVATTSLLNYFEYKNIYVRIILIDCCQNFIYQIA